MEYGLIQGDCLEVMSQMDANSVTAIVTDPPYGLEFMGKNWDHGVPGVSFWEQALRVAKPGAFLLAFGGTRTYHRLTCAIEDAGWEIRDCIMWVYGSGFPKSHDISKAIDTLLGAEREVVGTGMYANRGRTAGVKTNAMGAYSSSSNDVVTAPATPQAITWNGYGTALKPAFEPIIIAMKPIDDTFAHNALTHGVAGLNIEGCRVPAGDFAPKERVGATKLMEDRPWQDKQMQKGRPTIIEGHELGRWPANFIHDGSDEVMRLFPVTTSGNLSAGHKQGSGMFGKIGGDKITGSYGGDSGSAARFFYCAKSSQAERNAGIEGNGKLRKFGGHGNDEQDELTRKLGSNQPQANHHPTVKPLELMQYLCRLVKQPANNVLVDPFMGSGSTLIAAMREGFEMAMGIDREAEYIDIARQRLAHHANERSVTPVRVMGKATDTENLPLFA